MSPNDSPVPGRTLVLGGSGFLGVHVVELALVEQLRRGGGEVVSVGRSSHPVPSGARCEPCDASREGDLQARLDAERPARVLLIAALARTGECERRPSLAQALNADLPRHVGRWCAAAGARLLHVSTDLVFGATEAPPGGFREEHPTGPVSVYGATKTAGEAAVAEEYPAALVVRLPLLYGDSRGRALGASDSLLAAVARGERPGLFTDEWRTPLEVRAAARALVDLAFHAAAPCGLLHVAGSRRVQRHELGLAVLGAAGHTEEHARTLVRATTRAEAGGAASRPRDVSLDCGRASALLAWPLPDVAAGLRSPAR